MNRLELLREANPTAADHELRVFLDAMDKYRRAEQGLRKAGLLGRDKNGTIIENPLLKIQERCIKIMDGCGRIRNTEFLWKDEQYGDKEIDDRGKEGDGTAADAGGQGDG